MNSAICTLYEGHYHHGLAALCNSLYNNGYKGSIYIGYRGEIAPWAKSAKDDSSLNWEGGKTIGFAEGLYLHFLPIVTSLHLTNYKADFMLQLWEGHAKNMEGMFYFDPDIVIKCNFSFYEKWIQHGVALVHEITANDMTVNNPIRMLWREIINENNENVVNNLTSYINAGFFGLNKRHISFVEKVSKFVFIAKDKYHVNLNAFDFTDRTDPFFAKDQDILNIAAMCSEVPLCEIGPEGMDFVHGGFTMSHAIGGPKPWKKNFIKSFFKGNAPSLPDKAYWQHVDAPIKSFSNITIRNKRFSIKITSFLGRFYRKY